MSIDLSGTFASLEGVERSLAQLRSERERLESFFSYELEQLDKLRDELVDRSEKLDEERKARTDQCQQLDQQQRDLEERQHELERQQERVESERTSLDEQNQANQLDADSLEDKSRRLVEAKAELLQLRAKLPDEVESSKAAQRQSEQLWRPQIEQLENERHELSERLAAAEQQVAQATETARTLNELRSQFDAAQAELVEMRSAQSAQAEGHDEEVPKQLQQLLEERANRDRELEAARAEVAGASQATAELSAARDDLSTAREEIDSLREQLIVDRKNEDGDFQQRIAELEEDRTALELELEAVRNRSTELADSAAQKKRQAAEERAEWAAELKQLRMAMESQDRFLKGNDAVHVVADVAENNGARNSENTGNIRDDLMLDSLMNQFQQLQKDRIQRRANARVAAQQ